MKLCAKLAYSQLIFNHKRSIWTLAGIIISTLLLTTVSGLVASGSSSVFMLAGDPANHDTVLVLFLIPAIIFGTIIIAMSIIVISNGFRVSAADRTAQFGILKSAGATKQQIKATVMYESVFLSVIGIPIGIILGLLLTFVSVIIANHFLYDLNALTQVMIQELYIYMIFVISWQAILISAILAFATVLISAWRPARKAANITAIDSIRGVGEVKLESRQLRVSPLIHKLFGFPGVLAAKSLKRSRRNFRASVVSLTIAVILFVTASGATASLGQVYSMMFDNIEAPVIVDYVSARSWFRNEEAAYRWDLDVIAPIDSRLADKITARLREYDNTYVTGIGATDIESYIAILPSEIISPQMMQAIGRNYLSAGIITLDPESYASLLEIAGLPHGSNILINHFATLSRGRLTEFEPFIFNEGNFQLKYRSTGEIREIAIHATLSAGDIPAALMPANPAAVNEVRIIVPYGLMRGYSWYATPNNIESFMAYANLVMEEFFPNHAEGYYMERGFSVRVFETHDFIRVMNLGISIAIVFFYGFTALTTLIGLTSVISSISTNVRMRAKEFAVLQSVGLTREGIRHMLNLESILCSAKSILFGLPVAIALTYFIHLPISNMVPAVYRLPWLAIAICIIGVFSVTWITMRFSESYLRQVNRS